MRPTLVTPPAERLISADELMARAETLEGASLHSVNAMIDAATSTLDGWSGILGRCLVEQTWSVSYDDHCRGRYGLFLEALEVTKVSFRCEDVPERDYDLKRSWRGPYVEVHRYPGAAFAPCGEIVIEFTAGYGGPDKVPAAIKQAIVLMVIDMHAQMSAGGRLRSVTVDDVLTHAFNSPEQQTSANARTVEALIAPFRRMSV